MSELQEIAENNDLILLDSLADDCSFPVRDWESIIFTYNQGNRNFPISAIKCSKIIQRVRDGQLPKMVFREFGISYNNFNTRFTKMKENLEDIVSKKYLLESDINLINDYKNNPLFILGQDIERATAFNFNQSMDELKDLSSAKAIDWLAYMKEVHREEFTDKQEKKGMEVVIQFGPGLLDAI